MTVETNPSTVSELAALMQRFFECVSFEAGGAPAYGAIGELFIDTGLLIKNSASAPEICNIETFIEPRQAAVDAGELTRFRERELGSDTVVFGGVAHRFSGYEKSGTLRGVPFEGKGLVSTQFVLTSSGWRMSAMAWDDERAGIVVPERFR
jgi:hypothetical protein